MAKRADNKDFFEVEEIFKPQIDSVNGFILVLKEAIKETKEFAKEAKKKIRFIDPKDIDQLEKLNKLISQAEGLQKKYNAQASEESKLRKQLADLEDQQVKAKQRFLKANADQRKAIKNQIQIEQSLGVSIKSNADTLKNLERIEKVEVRTKNEAIAANKALRSIVNNLRTDVDEEAVAIRRLNSIIDKNDSLIKKNSDSLVKNRINVGNYTDSINRSRVALNKASAGFSRFLSAVGITAGLTGLVTGLRNAVNVITDFQQSSANLAAILGKSRDEISALTAEAERLGASTAFTASQVVQLETELAKLGFTERQILDATEGILNFAAATGTDLARSAALAGSAIRGFNLDASESGRVASVLGVSTARTALDVSKLENALNKVAPVASTFGFSIEDTVALLGQLANAGFSGEQAGTALRNILLNLADSNGKLAKSLGGSITSFDELIPAMVQLNESGIDLAGALELTDARSVAAFSTFLEGAESATKLRDSLIGVEDELQTMADEQLNTVTGSVKLLQSAWQGFILSMDNGEGFISGTLQKTLQFLAKNLNSIVTVITTLVGSFAALRIGTKLQNVALLNLTSTSSRFAATQRLAAKQTTLFGKASVFAGSGMKALNRAIRANPIGLLLTAFTLVIGAMQAFGQETQKTKVDIDGLAASVEGTNNKYEAHEKRVNTLVSEYETLTGKTELNKDEQERLRDVIGDLSEMVPEAAEEFDEYGRVISLNTDTIKTSTEALREFFLAQNQEKINQLRQALFDTGEEFKGSKTGIEEATNTLNQYQDLLDVPIEKIGELTLQQQQFQQDAAFSRIEIEKLNGELRTSAVDIIKAAEALEGLGITLTESEKQILAEARALFGLKGTIEEVTEATKTKNVESVKEIDILKQKIALINKEFLDRKINLTEGRRDEIEFLELEQERVRRQLELRRSFRFKDKQEREKNSVEILKLQLREAEIQRGIDNKTAANEEKQRKQQIANINRVFDEEKLILTQREASNTEFLLNEEDRLRTLLNFERLTADERLKIEQKLAENIRKQNDIQEKDAEKRAKKQKEEEKKRTKERIEAANQLADALVEAANKRTQKELEAINEEIEASKKREDDLRELARQGSLDADRSIAAEQRRREELEREEEALLRRQQLREFALTAFKTYGAKVEAGSEQPLAESIRDLSLLSAFVSSLPTFYQGTNTTVADALGAPDMSGRDGYIVRVDGSEKVLNPTISAMTGDSTTEEIGRVMQMYNNGLLTTVQAPTVLQNNNDGVIKELSQVKGLLKELNKKPTPGFNYEALGDWIINSMKKGNVLENRFERNKKYF